MDTRYSGPRRSPRRSAAPSYTPSGALAQLVERCLCMADVRGSTPLGSTYPRGRPTCGSAGRTAFCRLGRTSSQERGQRHPPRDSRSIRSSQWVRSRRGQRSCQARQSWTCRVTKTSGEKKAQPTNSASIPNSSSTGPSGPASGLPTTSGHISTTALSVTQPAAISPAFHGARSAWLSRRVRCGGSRGESRSRCVAQALRNGGER